MYRINIRSLKGEVLRFTNVASYEFKDGMLIFTDSKTQIKKQFPINNCEIEGGDDEAS